MLTALKKKEELVIYLAVAKEAVSAVLMTERVGKQMHIYFVSCALQGPKINYTPMEKPILALRFELEEHDIHYRPRTSVKGQILTDFIVERPDDDPPDTPMEDKEELLDPWILFTDGSSCTDSSRASLIITNLERTEFTYAIRFRFNATNNEAEYEALIAGLRIAKQMGVKYLQENVDSRLVANQVNGTYVAKEPGMIKYSEKVKNLASTFKEFSIKQVPRGRTKKQMHYARWQEILPEEKKKVSVVRRKARRFVVAKALRSGYYWPTMHVDARKLIRECNDCQTYGTKAMIPVEIGIPTLRSAEVDMIKNDEALGIKLDLLEEKREQEAKSKAMMEKYYNVRVHNTNFKPADFVYRSNKASHAEDGGKLRPK
uniref:Reverse transcriptase domain-containing protein n=1 Tax=Tanacetum cinerariifolium TaxID=118510 RepID=A0A6L2KQW8_TANCI|nr:reverse transcriptase domain-containing protein [Tanacetum cinerariifolium]